MESEIEKTIIQEIKKQKYPTQTSIAKALGKNRVIIQTLIKSMEERGLLKTMPVGRVQIVELIHE